MKKTLMIFAVALLAVTVVAPAFAAVEFKYGGQFRWRFENEDNVFDGTNLAGFYTNNGSGMTQADGSGRYANSDDNRRFIDQRLRLYFSFIASKNLKVVVKWEMGDAVWGMNSTTSSSVGNTGANAGANVGADAVSVEVKNAYVEFNIPSTPSTAIIGVQSINLLDSWIIDDDFAAAVLVTKLDPFKITLGYVGGQYGWERRAVPNTEMPLTNSNYNVDTVVGVVDYAEGPFKSSLIFLFQDGHSSDVSINPATLATPVRGFTGVGFNSSFGVLDTANPFPFSSNLGPRNNYLFDLGFNFTYKTDWLLAYVNFVKNFGSADLVYPPLDGTAAIAPQTAGLPVKIMSVDYTGFMVDAGVTYFCGPWTANIGGFYTSGPSIDSNPALNNLAGDPAYAAAFKKPFKGLSSGDINWFTYPLATAKYFSEIIGGGVLGDDLYAVRGYNINPKAGNIGQTGDSPYWRGYGFPTNLWTVTVGGSYQLAEQTKLSASYWYFGTASSVPVAYDILGNYKMSSSIGHELDFYLDQGIVDGLTLTLVGAYLIANDAFCPLPVNAPFASDGVINRIYQSNHADDAWELGARLQWNF
jgi:hypothetical protein